MSLRMQFLRNLSISVGMAFATSCFAMVAGMVGRAGLWTVPAIGISILIALAVAQAIGRLAKRFPSALGIRTYIKAAFGNTASLFFVFMYLFLIAVIAGVESNMFAAVVRQIFPASDGRAVIAALFALVVAMNILGYEFSRNAQLIMVAVMLASVLLLGFYGIAHADFSANWETWTSPDQLAAAPVAIVSAFFLLVGFEWVTSAVSGSRSASAQLPRVLTVSVILLGFVYVIFAAAAVAHIDHAVLVATVMPQMLLASKFWGVSGSWAVLIVSGLAVLTSFNAGVLGASRLVYGLAREGFLPRFLGTTVAFSGAPAAAIAATTLASLASAVVALAIDDNYLLGNVAAAAICICYCGLLSASLKLDLRSAGHALANTRRGERAAGCIALLSMGLLLVALLFQESTMLQAAIVFTVACVLLLFARFADRRTLLSV